MENSLAFGLTLRMGISMRILEEVREQIRKQGGKYSGSQVPNLQSAIDIFLLSDAEILDQVPDKYKMSIGDIEGYLAHLKTLIGD